MRQYDFFDRPFAYAWLLVALSFLAFPNDANSAQPDPVNTTRTKQSVGQFEIVELEDSAVALVNELIEKPADEHSDVLTKIDRHHQVDAIYSHILRPITNLVYFDHSLKVGRDPNARAFRSPRMVGNPFFKTEVFSVSEHLIRTRPDSELALLAALEIANQQQSLEQLLPVRQRIEPYPFQSAIHDAAMYRFWEVATSIASPVEVCQAVDASSSDYLFLLGFFEDRLSREQVFELGRDADRRIWAPGPNYLIACSLVDWLPVCQAGDADKTEHDLVIRLLRNVSRGRQFCSLLKDCAGAVLASYYYIAWGLGETSISDCLAECHYEIGRVIERSAGIQYLDDQSVRQQEALLGAVASFLKNDVEAVYRQTESWDRTPLEPSPSLPVSELHDRFFCEVILVARSYRNLPALAPLLQKMPTRYHLRYRPVLEAFFLRNQRELDKAIETMIANYGATIKQYHEHLQRRPDDSPDRQTMKGRFFANLIDYQLSLWLAERNEPETTIERIPDKAAFLVVLRQLKQAEQWNRVLDWVDVAADKELLGRTDSCQSRVAALYGLGRYQDVLDVVDLALMDIPFSENPISARSLDDAFWSALALGDLETVERWVRRERSDKRVNNFNHHTHAWLLSLLKENWAKAEVELRAAMNRELYRPAEDPTIDYSAVPDSIRHAAFGKGAQFKLQNKEYWGSGDKSVSVYLRQDRLLTTEQLQAVLQPVLGDVQDWKSIPTNFPDQKIWKTTLGHRELGVVHRLIAPRLPAIKLTPDQATRYEGIRSVVVLTYKRVLQSNRKAVAPDLLSLGRAIHKIQGVMLGRPVNKRVEQYISLHNLSSLEIDRLSSHGFAGAPGWRKLSLPSKTEIRNANDEFASAIARLADMEYDNGCEIILELEIGGARELISAEVIQCQRRFSGEVVLDLKLKESSSLNSTLQSGFVGVYQFDRSVPIEKQLYHLKSLSAKVNGKVERWVRDF